MARKGRYRTLDLFAGAGGMSRGFKDAGFDIVVANDAVSVAAATYRANFPTINFIEGDITKEWVKQMIVGAVKRGRVTTEDLSHRIPIDPEELPCDAIIGGPPCGSYSLSGASRKGVLKIKHGLRDSSHPRASLFKEYVDLVKRLHPKIFFMENVTGILKMKMGDKTVPEVIKEDFENVGYRVQRETLCAADYGSPQKRERVIFVGTPIGSPEFVYPEPTHGDGAGRSGKPLKPFNTMRQAIDDLKSAVARAYDVNHPYAKPTSEAAFFNHDEAKHTDQFIAQIKATPIGESLTSHLAADGTGGKQYSEAFFRARPDEPTPTAKANNGSVFVHYELSRTITPRELARLQDFPDDHVFLGSKHEVFVQVGNAVPRLLAAVLARACKTYLDGLDQIQGTKSKDGNKTVDAPSIDPKPATRGATEGGSSDAMQREGRSW